MALLHDIITNEDGLFEEFDSVIEGSVLSQHADAAKDGDLGLKIVGAFVNTGYAQTNAWAVGQGDTLALGFWLRCGAFSSGAVANIVHGPTNVFQISVSDASAVKNLKFKDVFLNRTFTASSALPVGQWIWVRVVITFANDSVAPYYSGVAVYLDNSLEIDLPPESESTYIYPETALRLGQNAGAGGPTSSCRVDMDTIKIGTTLADVAIPEYGPPSAVRLARHRLNLGIGVSI